MTRHDYLDKLDANLSGRASDVQTHYQDMSAGYSPLRLATPSGTGEAVQPCVNCGARVAPWDTTTWVRVGLAYAGEVQWLHLPDSNRACAS